MKKTLQLFCILILAMGIVLTPALGTINPTEVERIRDVYYFKIQGKIVAKVGRAEFVYKNLSPEKQYVIVNIQNMYGESPPGTMCEVFGGTIASGETEAGGITENFDVNVNFELWIYSNDPTVSGSILLAYFSETIWIPPEQP